MSRSKLTRLRAAAAGALLSLSLAAPAFAGHDDWDDGGDDGRRRGYPVHRHDRSCDNDRDRWERGGHRGHYDDRGHYGDRGHWGDRSHYGRGHRDHGAYGCRPCGRRWDSRHAFHRHLAHSHHIPFWAFPRVVVAVDWGWVFRG